MLSLCCALLFAETLPSKGTTDSRIRSAMYRSDEVYRLVSFVGYAIELVFDKGEVFAGDGVADRVPPCCIIQIVAASTPASRSKTCSQSTE